MWLLERQPVDTLPDNAPSGVRYGTRFDGQLLDLPLGKATVGSSPRCNLRIQQPGVQPLHLLIAQEGERLSVRRWASDALLNGEPFDEAPLAVGDWLSVGSVELEIVDLDAPDESSANRECDALSEIATFESKTDKASELAVAREPTIELAAFAPIEAATEPAVETAGVHGIVADLAVEVTSLLQQLDDILQRVTSWEHDCAQWRETRGIWQQHQDEWVQQRGEWNRRVTACESGLEEHARRMDDLQQEMAAVRTLQAMPTAPVAPADDAWRSSERRYNQLAAAGIRIEPIQESVEHLAVEAEVAVKEDADALDADASLPKTSGEFDMSTVRRSSADPDAQNTAEEADAFDAPAAVERVADIDPAAGNPPMATVEDAASSDAAAPAPQTFRSTSFNDRYAHMFADEDAAGGAPPAAAPKQPLASEMFAPKTCNMDDIRRSGGPQPSSTVDEESIEQYMAKLLQRVRGDGPRLPASQAPPPEAAAANTPAVNTPAVSAQETTCLTDAPPAVSAGDARQFVESASQSAANFAERWRKQAMPAPTKDLEALRALANESARRAISTHARRKHRRTAVTKVIIATLAGVTSLWLMLQSPDWRDTQFITVSVLMLVAAYWAALTYRTLFDSLRDAAYGGTEDELDDLDGSLDMRLPIDVG